MSTIRVDDVGPSAGGTTKSLVRGTASAWVNLNGTGTIASRDSENVSSLTDNGTGQYYINLTNAMSTASDYVVSSTNGSATVFTSREDIATSAPVSSSQLYVASYSSITTSGADPDFVLSLIHGDLA